MAAQRPPGQAWFRLPTMRPPAPAPAPAPPPAPAPAPPPAVVRPAIPIRPSTQPQVPPAATSQPPSPPPRSTVAPPAASPAAPPPPLSSPMITKEAITTTSTKTQQTPSPSPQKKAHALSSTSNGRGPSSRPPSPLQLPPAQIKPSEEAAVEQKSVLVQESNEKQPLKTGNALAHNYSSKGKRDTPTKDKKQNSDSEDLGMRIITIAGENRGALMEISFSHKKSSNGYTLEKGKNGKGEGGQISDDESQPTTTFLNSNVQGVNNSIVYNSSCSHNDPGIHLSLVRKGNGNNGQNHHHHG